MQKLSPLFVLSLSATLLMLGVGMIVALLPQRVFDMTGSLESVALIASVFALAYVLAQLPISVLSDRLGPKWFLVAGYLTCAVSGVIFYSTESAVGMFLGRAVQGLGEASIWALGPAVLSLAYPTSKGRAIGIYNFAIHAGLTAGPLLGLFLAPDGLGRLPFLVFAVLCVLSGACVLFFLRPARGAVGPSRLSTRQFLGLFRQRRIVILLFGVLLYGAGYSVFLTVLPVSLAASHGFDATSTSLHFVLFYATISLSQIVAGTVSDRIGRPGFLIWGMALAAIGLSVLPLFSGMWAYLPLGLAGIGLGVFCVASIAELNDLAPDTLKGAVSGGYYFFWGMGYVLGPLVLGVVGANTPMIGFSALSALFGILALTLNRNRA